MRLYNPKFPNVFSKKDTKGKIKLYTPNLTPGIKYFDEDIERFDGMEFRNWDPKRSKLAAGIINDLSQIGIKEGNTVLYLGASHGYT
ncbi:MAG: fibrillarin-like rRNA/tRNA 2'-O-methyltransferase, partial [Candidatus Woesearchaeota archaeon]|nr:fibrillarin-like rRNA/tRNA 2'-O-methyltransferase [Candidatus Woesearchaeota archaeon]